MPLKTATTPLAPLDRFRNSLSELPDVAAAIHDGQIGSDATITGPFGHQKLIYADYVASGRALRQIESFVMDEVLPYYANSHTEASFCGSYITRMREHARRVILASVGGNAADHAVIFTGSGATGALNRLVHLFGICQALAGGQQVYVLVGPYEHHSNLLPWRESGATVIEIDEADGGGPDLNHLCKVLAQVADKGPLIGAFSAASNVTGVCTDIAPVSRLIKAAGGQMAWDFAGGAPYLPIELSPDIDAISLSAHKFIGGPGASGILVIRRDAVRSKIPGNPGGGTVIFVNNKIHDYTQKLEEREEGGTPNIIGDIRAALVFMVKDAIGQEFITKQNAELTRRAFAAWGGNPHIELLGVNRKTRLPILSFIIHDDAGGLVDYDLFTRLLSDKYGIQARGGCACAGPYVHRLLHIDEARSNQLRTEILAGNASHKPGFIRLNLSYLMEDTEVEFILKSVVELAATFEDFAGVYRQDKAQAAE